MVSQAKTSVLRPVTAIMKYPVLFITPVECWTSSKALLFICSRRRLYTWRAKVYDGFVRKVCAKIEAVCISVDYARGPEVKFPGAAHDFYDVFQYIASGNFGDEIDSSKNNVSGDSAGGNLTAVVSSLAVKDGLQNVKLQAPLCGVFDMTDDGAANSRSWDAFGNDHFLDRATMDFFKESYISNPDDTRNEMASPLLASSFKDLPRTYIAACSHDPLLSDSIAYKKKLQKFNVEHELKIFPGIHVFWMIPKACQEAACEEFIDVLCEHVQDAFTNPILEVCCSKRGSQSVYILILSLIFTCFNYQFNC